MKFIFPLRLCRATCVTFMLLPVGPLFAQVVDLDVPYVTTPQSVSEAMLTIAGLADWRKQ